MACSAKEALRKELKQPADDCYVDSEWMKGQEARLESAIGFQMDDE